MFYWEQGVSDMGALFVGAGEKRLSHIGGLITLLAVLIPAVAFLIFDHGPQITKEKPSSVIRRSSSFVLLLITLGAHLAHSCLVHRDRVILR